MKPTAVLVLVLLCTACHHSPETDRMKSDIDSTHRQYKKARQELKLKKDSAKLRDMSKDAAFLTRLSDAESRAVHLKDELNQKKSTLKARRKGSGESNPSSVAQ